MKKLKALFIISRPIYPIIGGDQIRTEQQLEFLSRNFDVDIVSLCEGKYPDTNNYLKYAKNVIFFHRSKIRCMVGSLLFLVNRLPIQVNYYYDRKMKRYINNSASNYDLVFCNNIRTAEYGRNLKGPKTVIDFVDAISMNYEKARKHSKGLKKIIYEIDFLRCKDYEHIVRKDFDACAIISEVDKNFIER